MWYANTQFVCIDVVLLLDPFKFKNSVFCSIFVENVCKEGHSSNRTCVCTTSFGPGRFLKTLSV